MIEDVELVRRYRERRSDEAFAKIVDRYVDMVYSVAFRQLGGDEHLARDVCQEVFVTLARKMDTLSIRVILSGWLYRCALFAAKDLRRREQRRRKREALAMLEFDAEEGAHVDWERLRPVLDEAICELSEVDRDAVCMRYFQDLSYVKIGAQLNLSENASRMRVERALEKLNGLLARKKTGTTVAALAAALGGQSALAAPVGLSVIVSQVAAASVTSGATVSTMSLIINYMNTSKLTAALAVLVSSVSVGVAVYQGQELEAAKIELTNRASYEVSNTGDSTELDALKSRLADLDAVLAQLSQPPPAPVSFHGFSVEEFENELETWAMKVDGLAAFLEQNQYLWIPELELLTQKDWLDGAKHATLNSEADYRQYLSILRTTAKHKVFPEIVKALKLYKENNNGRFPTEAMELLEYAEAKLDAAILKRYHVSQPGEHPFIRNSNDAVALVEGDLADPVWDSQFYLSEGGTSGYRYSPLQWLSSDVAKAMSAFSAENNRAASTVEELASYFNSDEQMELRAEVFRAMQDKPDFSREEKQSSD